MNKTELIDAIAASTGLSKTDAGRALNAMTDTVVKTVRKGDAVTIPGFGSFSLVKRKARAGRNPATGDAIKIKASKSAKFSIGATFKNALN